MQILTKGTNLDRFFERVSSGPERLLVLDYDGTLAPFRIERSEAAPYPGVLPLVRSVMAGERSRVVIVSGRSVEDLEKLLGTDHLPELYGSHGWEHRDTDGKRRSLPLDAGHLRGLGEALSFVEKENLSGLAEKKHGSIALHWRGRSEDEVAALLDRVRGSWSGIVAAYGLELRPFDGGIELRTPGNDKGTALRAILDGSDPGAAAAYLGDDSTDEDAFAALEGRGLGVLVNENPRETRADIWITPPDELIQFLSRWADACRR